MSYWSGGYFDWAPYKSVAERRADAARTIRDAARRGRAMSPVVTTGRKIAQTFWGKAWCDNLERYRDFAYRLERGRSYLRSGSVVDLRIEPGKIVAAVSGSSLYDIGIEIDAVKRDAWRAIQRDCAGGIGSRIDLLSGKLSEPVMVRLCADRTGLFPAPSAIRFSCSCPDYATMCKHVAAAMYGVGVRLDQAPELLFTLRRVSLDELLASAVTELPATPSGDRVLATKGLAAMFGIEIADASAPPDTAARSRDATKASRSAGTAARKSAPPGVQPARGADANALRARPAKRRPARAPASAGKAASPDRRLDALIRELASAWKLPAMHTKATSRTRAPVSRTRQSTSRTKPASRTRKPASRTRQSTPPAPRVVKRARRPTS